MNKLVAFCGKKQSGKSSSAKFVIANEMMSAGLVRQIGIMDNGDIGVHNDQDEMVALDLDSKSPQAFAFFNMNLWPKVRKFSFADRLKVSVHSIFDVDMKLLYGTDEDKNQLTKIKASDFFGTIDVNICKKLKEQGEDKLLTVRQLLQLFGTDLCRKIYDRCWVDGLLSDIAEYGSDLSLVDDCRFKNEVYALKEAGAILIKLNRNSNNGDNHSSEIDLDSIDDSVFDLVINNQDLTLEAKNTKVIDFLVGKSIIDKGYYDNGVTTLKG